LFIIFPIIFDVILIYIIFKFNLKNFYILLFIFFNILIFFIPKISKYFDSSLLDIIILIILFILLFYPLLVHKYDKNKKLDDEYIYIKKVFISYSHNDNNFVIKLKNDLEKQNIKIKIDIEKLCFGDDINDFINKSIEESDLTISIISKNSLRSPWVFIEASETLLNQKFKKIKKFVPIYIDTDILQNNTYLEVLNTIEIGIDDIDKFIIKALNKRTSISIYSDRRERLLDFKNNVHKFFNELQKKLMADFTKYNYNDNLLKLINQIKNNNYDIN